VPITNLSTLRTAVRDFLQRSDLAAHIDDFIELATARFSDELRTPEMETLSTTTLTGEWTALPIDFRAIRLLESGGEILEYRTAWQLQRMIQNAARPHAPVFSIQDMMFRVYPFPSSSTVELTYYAALPALSTPTSTNWLLLKRPDVYLHAALAQARLFLHDDERIAMAAAFTDKYIAEANRAARHIAVGAAPLAVRVA
jgi:hypothetical protein